MVVGPRSCLRTYAPCLRRHRQKAIRSSSAFTISCCLHTIQQYVIVSTHSHTHKKKKKKKKKRHKSYYPGQRRTNKNEEHGSIMSIWQRRAKSSVQTSVRNFCLALIARYRAWYQLIEQCSSFMMILFFFYFFFVQGSSSSTFTIPAPLLWPFTADFSSALSVQ